MKLQKTVKLQKKKNEFHNNNCDIMGEDRTMKKWVLSTFGGEVFS